MASNLLQTRLYVPLDAPARQRAPNDSSFLPGGVNGTVTAYLPGVANSIAGSQLLHLLLTAFCLFFMHYLHHMLRLLYILVVFLVLHGVPDLS